MPRTVALLLTALALPGCNADPVEEGPIPDADVRVLFVGNSLTVANDLPGMVRAIAEGAGRTFEHRVVAGPNLSLEDHWHRGVEDAIRRAEADVVVMQQGPSSVGANPLHLRSWTEALAPAIREAGGEPALLMVWPEASRTSAFDAVRDSYRGAAEAVGGYFIPAGQSWRVAWEEDPGVPTYGPDGFHPSVTGSFLAAATTYAVLFDADPRGLPAVIVPESRAERYYEAAWTAREEWALSPSSAAEPVR